MLQNHVFNMILIVLGSAFLGDSSQGESSIIYYPSREDPDHVVAFLGEIAKLAPEQCLNDSIMNIYIR